MVGKLGKTRVRAREEPMVRWRRGMAHHSRHRIDMALRHWGAHGDNFGAQCVPGVRKKASFTHVRDNLRGDVSGKRFSAHVVEGNVARIGEGRCGNDKGKECA